MTRREHLLDQYENALFALLMDDLAWQEGERLLEENERLKNDPDADVPEEVMTRCRKVINREFTRKHISKVGHASWKVFRRIAVAACMAGLLFTVAFAVSDTVRINTLNLMIETFDRYTNYSFVPSSNTESASAASEFKIGKLPEGFTLTDYKSTQMGEDYTYIGPHGEELYVSLNIFSSGSSPISIDTENADIEDITINGREAQLISKDYYQIVVPFPEKMQLLFVAFWSETDLPPKEEFTQIVEDIFIQE